MIEAQLRECYGRVVYSHKTHEKCADLLIGRHSTIKLVQIVLSSMTTAGFVAAILDDGPCAATVGALLSAVLLALTTYTKNYDLGELAERHRHAAADLWLIREKYLSLLTDLRTRPADADSVLERRDALLEDLHAVYSGSPATTFEAYRKAQTALQQNEDMTFTDAEIDAFLPSALRLSEPSGGTGPTLEDGGPTTCSS